MKNTHRARATIAAVALAATAALTSCSSMNQEWHNACTVVAKDTLYGSTDGSTTREYRLTTSCGTFTVGDSIAGGFSSWDTWAKLRVGGVYDLKTGGYRMGWASSFPTVIEVRQAKP